MKKLIAAALMLTLTLSLGACNRSGNDMPTVTMPSIPPFTEPSENTTVPATRDSEPEVSKGTTAPSHSESTTEGTVEHSQESRMLK